MHFDKTQQKESLRYSLCTWHLINKEAHITVISTKGKVGAAARNKEIKKCYPTKGTKYIFNTIVWWLVVLNK